MRNKLEQISSIFQNKIKTRTFEITKQKNNFQNFTQKLNKK